MSSTSNIPTNEYIYFKLVKKDNYLIANINVEKLKELRLRKKIREKF